MLARVRRLAPFVLALVLAPAALAQVLPQPEGARSLEVVEAGATIRAAPSSHAPRRGTVRVGTRLPFERRVTGLGCPGGEWYRLGEEQYICESLVVPRDEEPAGDEVPVVRAGELLPRQYAFVGTDGTWAYSRPTDYFQEEYVESLGRGFGLAITDVRTVGGVTFLRSLSGLWVADDDVRHARGSDFAGVDLSGGAPLDVAWAVRGGAALRAWNGRRAGSVVRRLGAREVVHVLEDVGRGLVRVEGGVIAARELHRPTLSAPPPEVGATERWIDVEIASQTLVAYEGATPVFATLVSTGRAGESHATPLGTFRIWVKLAEDTMDDLDRTDQESNYAIEAVPWVQYFQEGVALHAAFWHDQFGTRRSHGCVNLAPRDARRLFGWTAPQLPRGWDAILTTATQPGTVVRVR